MGRHALLLGAATFHADAELEALPGTRQDIGQLKSILDELGRFDSVDAHLDLPRAHLTAALEDFFGARRSGDTALLYYSGHGLTMMDSLDRESVFLAASDTNQAQLHTTAIDTDGVLRHLLNITRASQKIVLLDCCYSGAFTARGRFRGGVRAEPRRGIRERGTVILSSSTHSRASKAQGAGLPSVFTDVVLRGLRGEAASAGDDGWITSTDLFGYVQAEMARRGPHGPVASSEGVTEPIRLVLRPDADTGAAPRPGVQAPRALADGEDTFDADRWRRLVRYYISCMDRAAALAAFLPLADRGSYRPLPAGAEPALSTPGGAVLPAELVEFGRGCGAAGTALLYGYPVVVLRPVRASRPAVTPLLVCDASVGPDGRLYAALPRPNEALAREAGLGAPEIDELVRQVEESFTPGDPAALAETVRQLMAVLDLRPATGTDPGALTGAVTAGPLRRVQNSAILYTVDSGGGAQRGLFRDLREHIAAKAASIRGTALNALAEPEPIGEPGGQHGGGAAGGVQRAEPGGAPPIVAPDRLNEAQERVIISAMSRRLTVAQGPPGTGKSQLVAALTATATAAGQTVLIGSTNNRAVDEVCERMTDRVGAGLVVRTGNRDYQAQEPKLLTDLLTAHAGRAAPGDADEATLGAQLRIAAGEVRELRSTLDARRLLERDLADLAAERQVDRSGGAGDPSIHAPGLARLPDGDGELAVLAETTDRALRHRVRGWWARRRLRARGLRERHEIEEFGYRVTVELRWRDGQRRLAALPAERGTWSRLTEVIDTERPEDSRLLLRAQLARRVRTGSALLRQRCEELSRPSPSSWQGFTRVLCHLPAWALTALSARAVPPNPALFDLVIIDEAAQCTIPAVLPMLYRAKRALIIGDPRQLAPVVTLPESEEPSHQTEAGLGAGWLARHRLRYTKDSAFDAFALVAGEVHLLDEHYRCHPDIVAEPNRQVYQGRLAVLTDVRRLAAPAQPAARWKHVPGAFSRGRSGSGYNEPEVAAVLAEVRRLCAEHPAASVGVVTPLAAQQRRLGDALRAAGLDAVACGTVHRFQGGERDIMVISPVGADGVRDSTRSWLVRQTNLWNVAITRARSQLVVVGDRSWWAAQQGLLTALTGGAPATADPAAPGARAADRLHAALRARGVTVRRDVTVGGYRFDVEAGDPGGRRRLAVLVDDPGGDADGRALRRVLALLDVASAAGPVLRTPAWRCLAIPDQVADEIAARLA